MFTAKKWLFLYVLVFLGYNSIYNYNAGALTLDYSKDRFGVMEGVQTDTIFAVSDTTGGDTASQIRYNTGEDKWEYTNDGTNYYDLHTHSNKATLDLIDEALTTALKILYDATAADSHVQNTDQYLDQGGANEVTAANAKDAVDKKHSQNTDTGTSGNFAIIGDLTVDTPTLFTTGNKVGIGTTDAPVATLMVGGSAPTRDLWNAAIEIQPSVGSGQTPSLFFGGQTTNEYSSITWTTSTSGSTSQSRTAMIYAQPTSATNADLHFRTNDAIGSAGPTEKMTILGNGNVGIGTTTPLAKLQVNKSWTGYYGSMALTDTDGSSGAGITFWTNNMETRRAIIGDGSYFAIGSIANINVGFLTSSQVRMTIDSGGNVGIGTGFTSPSHLIHLLNSSGAYSDGYNWTSTSDLAYKKDISYQFPYGLQEILKLKPATFIHKQDKKQKKDIGFIAQDVKKTIPELIEGEEGGYGMNYGNLTAVLVKAIQEQQEQIKNQQKQIDDLIKRITLLESKTR